MYGGVDKLRCLSALSLDTYLPAEYVFELLYFYFVRVTDEPA